MPPYSTAAALRGASVMTGVAGLLHHGEATLKVITTTRKPVALDGMEVCTLDVSEIDNTDNLIVRIWRELYIGWCAARMMFDKNNHCDLAIISSPSYLTALILCSRARKRNVPYVLDVRDIYPQVYAEAGLLKRKSWLYRFFLYQSRKMYRDAAHVITATRGLAKAVTEQVPSASVSCVYNGFPSELCRRRATKHDRFTVCFHGILGFFQDVESLVEIAYALQAREVDVLVIGYGRKESLLRSTELSNLRFLGRLEFEDTIAEIERCHMGLCLRLNDAISKDAFPVKVWEYLGLGIPCVVTPQCEGGQFLEENSCGFQVTSGNVQDIVNVILKLKNSPQYLSSLAENCRLIAKYYTREQAGVIAGKIILKQVR